MHSRRLDHGSSGELDVFGATSYFAGGGGLLPDDDTDEPPSPADRRLFQANKVLVQRDTMESSSPRRHVVVPQQRYLGLGVQVQHQHGDAEEHRRRHAAQFQQVVVAKRQPSGKSKLAALLSFMVSPSPRASFRKEAAPASLPQAAAAAAGDEPACNNSYKPVLSSPSSSRQSSMRLLQGLFGAHEYDDDDLDLGEATGDRRLQGVRVVRAGGCEERWVVRCVRGAWENDEEQQCRDKMLSDEASSSDEKNKQDEVEEGDDDGNREGRCWDSDSSSDLFDLNLL